MNMKQNTLEKAEMTHLSRCGQLKKHMHKEEHEWLKRYNG